MVTAAARAGAVALAVLATIAPRSSEAAAPAGPLVAIRTTAGTIVLRLDARHAPRTTANFLHYVDAHAYDGAQFYRTVRRATEPQSRIEVIQGGMGPQGGSASNRPVAMETTGLHNVDGAIAMARTADPNSASTEFFIDIGDDRFLDAGGATGAGYAVFGAVVRGMDVVRKIHTAPASGETLTPAIRIVTVTRIP